jgi:ADP-heptose:LPS heptosyltransferase
LPAFDEPGPLLSLPLAFRTTLSSIPAERGYLRCDPEVVAQWRERLGPKNALRVGVVWKGTSEKRSIPLSDMLKLVTGNAQFFSLQKDVTAEDQAILDARKDIVQPGVELRNFADAPLVDLMDVVITVDTSMAHLAGALGKTVWVMLPFSSDWRWMRGRDDSPWYPSARLFRATAIGDWASALSRIRESLRAEILTARA